MVETPVLYITFARPEYACHSFAAIKKAKPKKLYFYSNKARSDKADEVQRNEEVRSYINQIDWECDVKIWFRDEYVDVFTSLWGAIDWIFYNEEKAIIIEEDVVASLAFFDYVEKLIDKYKDNEKVWIISGNNAAPQYNPKGLSFFPTRWANIYGWASWRNRWWALDRKMSYWNSYKNRKEYRGYYDDWFSAWFFKIKGNNLYKKMQGNYNPWDMIFNNNMRKNYGYCIIPHSNLCKDIGIIGANHEKARKNPLAIVSYTHSEFIIENEPKEIVPTDYDLVYFYKHFLKKFIYRRLMKIIKR